MRLKSAFAPSEKNALISEYNCEWRVGDAPVQTAPCDGTVTASLPYPSGADISVAVAGEQPIALKAKVRDLLIVGMGDSFASGEGNPDMPAEFSEAQRHNNLYPRRKNNDASGSAQWTDELCHRSLYGHQLRAALQIAIENHPVGGDIFGLRLFRRRHRSGHSWPPGICRECQHHQRRDI